MKYILTLLLSFSIHFSQGIEWEIIEQIPVGYHYVTDTNSHGDMVVGGYDLNDDYAMQMYYKQNNENWINIPGNQAVLIMSGDVLITDTQNIYVCDFAMGLFRTNDLGGSWTDLAELTNEGCSAFNIHQSGTFFIGMTYNGIGFIHRSFDSGISWEAIPLPDYDSNYPVEHIEFDSEGNIYLGTINGIYKSTDIGENWNKVNNGLDGDHVSNIFIDDNDNIYIYTTYSAQADGMYYSFNGAESWVNFPIPGYYVVDIVVQDDLIMIIDGDNNIQFTENLGNTWHVAIDGLNDNSLYSLHLVQDNTVYVGGRYLHKSEGSINECLDLFGLDFGPCTMVLGIGYVNGECSYVSGCSSILNGIDYSDALFDSMDECLSSCIENNYDLGDINGDGQINILDIVLATNMVLEDEYDGVADVNEDGELDILDLVTLVNWVLYGVPDDPVTEWVTVPAGDYTYGEFDEILNIDYDYQLSKYEITNGQYMIYLEDALASGDIDVLLGSVLGYYTGDEENPAGDYIYLEFIDEHCRIIYDGISFSIVDGYEDHPVVEVSWFGANAFAEYYGWRLPDEYEWEKAARGDTGYNYPFGNSMNGSQANYYDSGDPYEQAEWSDWPNTSPVGFYNGQNFEGFQTTNSPSPYGAYDMAGNVWEYTGSWYFDGSSLRVRRGGSWYVGLTSGWCRSWLRDGNTPSGTYYDIGFRVAHILP